MLCTHRPVLPTVVDVLAQHARRSVADALPASDPFLHPAQVLVAHVAQTPKGPRVVATETHRPREALSERRRLRSRIGLRIQ